MAYRKIDCVLGGGEGDAAGLATAFALARPAGGHVSVLHVQPDPRDAVPMLGEGVSGALVGEIMANATREATTRTSAARDLFERERERAGATVIEVPPGPGGLTTAFRVLTGRPEEVVARTARLTDLTVFPRLSRRDTDTAAELMLEAALLESGRPLLIAPAVPTASIARRIAIAWNGGAEAARAVAFALDAICGADAVTVLTAPTTRTDAGAAADLVDYLAWHGVQAAQREVTHVGEPVGAALLRAAAESGADLLVMGGYGTSRLRELILGGVTRHVLAEADLPVLMAH